MNEYNVDNLMGAVGGTESTEDNVPVPMDEEAAGVADAADAQQASPARQCFTARTSYPARMCVSGSCAHAQCTTVLVVASPCQRSHTRKQLSL